MDLAALIERVNTVLYAVAVVAVLSGVAVVLSGWLLWVRQRDRAENATWRAEDATWRARVMSRLFPEEAGGAPAALPAAPVEEALYSAFGERSSSSSEPPEEEMPPPRMTIVPRTRRGR